MDRNKEKKEKNNTIVLEERRRGNCLVLGPGAKSGVETFGRNANVYTQHPRMGPQWATECHTCYYMHYNNTLQQIGRSINYRTRKSPVSSKPITSCDVWDPLVKSFPSAIYSTGELCRVSLRFKPRRRTPEGPQGGKGFRDVIMCHQEKHLPTRHK